MLNSEDGGESTLNKFERLTSKTGLLQINPRRRRAAPMCNCKEVFVRRSIIWAVSPNRDSVVAAMRREGCCDAILELLVCIVVICA